MDKKEVIGELRVWWITNPPSKPFHIIVDNLEDAKQKLNMLADYNLHLGDLIHSNAGGLEVLEEEGWEDWYSDDGRDIDEIELKELLQCGCG